MGDDSDGYNIITPIGLSEKALGKRRVVEEDDRMYPGLLSCPPDELYCCQASPMLVTVSLDRTEFEQVLLIHSISAPLTATEYLGIR